MNDIVNVSQFGRHLRSWRRKRRLSQLQLSGAAGTTPRHVSFLETGRSRPGSDIVLRLARALDLSMRDTNALLRSAGLPPVFSEDPFDSATIRPYRQAIEAMLKNHDPFPASVLDPAGNILMANRSFHLFAPGAAETSPEDRLLAFLKPDGPARQSLENWAEAAWHIVALQQREFENTNNPRIARQIALARESLANVPAPAAENATEVMFTTRMRIGADVLTSFTTVMRFETASDITLGELRIELVFPADDWSRRYFENLFASGRPLP